MHESAVNHSSLSGFISLNNTKEKLKNLAWGNDLIALSDHLKTELSERDYREIRATAGNAGSVGLVLSYLIKLEDGSEIDP